jgi:CRP/FNR family transcriptional regulator, anaerobic regulatory protein
MSVNEFESYLRTSGNLSNEEIERISSMATPISLQRNDLLLQEGQICRHKTFIIKGLLRVYGTSPDGGDAILQFNTEHTWTLDPESYDHQTPTVFNIGAVEPCELLQWTKPDFDRLLAELPRLRALSEQLIARSNHNSRQRLFSALSATPEEKYENFVQAYPELLARLPLHMIAAYLGISLKTLTRIRHAQLHR